MPPPPLFGWCWPMSGLGEGWPGVFLPPADPGVSRPADPGVPGLDLSPAGLAALLPLGLRMGPPTAWPGLPWLPGWEGEMPAGGRGWLWPGWGCRCIIII